MGAAGASPRALRAVIPEWGRWADLGAEQRAGGTRRELESARTVVNAVGTQTFLSFPKRSAQLVHGLLESLGLIRYA